MATFSAILKDLRLQRGMTQAELARILNTAKSTVSMYENGKRTPDFETLEAIADYFNVDMNYLLGRAKDSHAAALPDYPGIRPITTHKVPLLGSIACGEPIFANEEHESYIEAGTDIRADFALKASGDSMTGARILDGDIVFIRRQNMVDNGDIAAVAIGDEVTLKRVYYYPDEGRLMLISENPKYSPFLFVGSELDGIYILGRAIAFQSDIR